VSSRTGSLKEEKVAGTPYLTDRLDSGVQHTAQYIPSDEFSGLRPPRLGRARLISMVYTVYSVAMIVLSLIIKDTTRYEVVIHIRRQHHHDYSTILVDRSTGSESFHDRATCDAGREHY